MSEKKKVVSWDNLPTRLPFETTLLIIIALKVWDVQGEMQGAIIVITALIWLVCLVSIGKEEHQNIFK